MGNFSKPKRNVNSECTVGKNAMFEDILKDARTSSLDPRCCIPYCRVRKITEFGVRRLIKEVLQDGDIGGLSATGNLPTVVELSDNQIPLVREFLIQERKVSANDAEKIIEQHGNWYGIVDGAHRNEALRRIIEQHSDRALGVSWTVLLLKNCRMSYLRAFARNCNDKQDQDYIVAPTLYDRISSMQEDVLSLQKLAPNYSPTVSEIIAYYYTGDMKKKVKGKVNSTLRSIAKAAMSLSPEVLEVLGDILNREEPETALALARPTDNKDFVDMRVLRNVMSAYTMRTASSFLDSSGPDKDENQVNALYRAASSYRQSNYKISVSGEKLNEMYEAAARALIEVRKMGEVLADDEWPVEMYTIRKNMLRTSQLDRRISLHSGNNTELFQPLLESFAEAYPGFYKSKLATWRAEKFGIGRNPQPLLHSAERATSAAWNEGVENETPRPLQTPGLQPGSITPAMQRTLFPMETPQQEIEEQVAHSQNVQEDFQSKLSELEKAGVNIYQMSLQKFEYQKIDDENPELYDMVFLRAPVSMCSAIMEDFCVMSRKILHPGRYLFVIDQWERLHLWKLAMLKADLDVMSAPFHIVYDSSLVQRNRSVTMPQSCVQHGFVSMRRGQSHQDFKINLADPYLHLSCTHRRKFGIIDKIPPVRNFLRKRMTRAHLVDDELPMELMVELLSTFAPVGGHIFDPFGKALETACAAVYTGRKCTTLEENEDTLRNAMSRLTKLVSILQKSRSFRSDERAKQAAKRLMFDSYAESKRNTGGENGGEFGEGNEEEFEKACHSESTASGQDSQVFEENQQIGTANDKNCASGSPLKKRKSAPEGHILSTHGKFDCRVVGCTLEKGSATGHNCSICSAPVHSICCQRILKITVEDSCTPLFCSRCYRDLC